MNILRGLMPSVTPTSAAARPVVRAVKKAARSPIAPSLRDRAIEVLRAKPFMPIDEVRVAIGARSISPVCDAVAVLKASGQLQLGRRTTLTASDRKMLLVLRAKPHVSTAELAAILHTSEDVVRARVRRLIGLGMLLRSIKTVYTWVVQ